MEIKDLTIAVCCNRLDVFIARICVASIRYYYPDITIELIKDNGRGKFSTKDIEIFHDVKLIELGPKKYGWSGAKFFYLYKMPIGKKVLLLDADIIFIGPCLERLLSKIATNDYVVSIEPEKDPYTKWAKDTYFDTKNIEEKYKDYRYPGYFFNAGQIFATVGSIEKSTLDIFFDTEYYPYWKLNKDFPLVDQSVYNYLLPSLADKGALKLGTDSFMLWSLSAHTQTIKLEDVQNKVLRAGMIHWAGDKRHASISGMTRSDLLHFFKTYYYQDISNKNILKLKHHLSYLFFNLKQKLSLITYQKLHKKFLSYFK